MNGLWKVNGGIGGEVVLGLNQWIWPHADIRHLSRRIRENRDLTFT